MSRLGRWRLQAALALVGLLGFLVPRRHRAVWRAEWRGELSYLSAAERGPGRGGGGARHPGILAHSLTSIPHAAAYFRHEWSPDVLLRELRHAIRRLTSHPGFTVVAILTIAIGVAANTAIFSVVNSTLLNPLPYPESERLVYLWKQAPEMDLLTTPNAGDIALWREHARSFEEIQIYAGEELILTGGDEPRDLVGLRVLPGFFGFLGVQPARGREFSEEEARLEARVVILGHGLWQTYFGGAEEVLGRTVVLDGEPHSVIGVMPADFHFQAPFDDTQLWLPMTVEAAEEHASPFAIARLREGVSSAAADQELAALAAGVEQESGEERWPGKARRPQDLLGGTFRTSLLVLQAAVAMVLLIACANVANLLLARGTTQATEMAVRAALGAGRDRLLRQAFTEHLLLALGGGLLGYGLARAGVAAIMLYRPERLAALAGVRVDGWMLLFAVGGAVLTGLIFGAVPALQGSRPDLLGQLRQAGSAGSAPPGRCWFGSGLVVAEVALALLLLVGAGLLIGSLSRMLNADLGFDAGNVLVMSVSLPEDGYADDAQRLEFRERVESGIRQVAGARLEGLAVSGGLLPSLGLSFGTFAAEAEEPLPGFTNVAAHGGSVSPGFFATLGVPLVDGRDFTADDVGHPDNPVIVNAGWARRMWGDERAAGRRIESPGREGPTYRTVVGVIQDAKLTGATGPFNELQIYYPRMAFETLGLMIRTSGDPLPLAGAIRERIWAIDPSLPINGVSLLDRVYAGGLATQRFNATLMGVFAGVAVLLALIGVYGVLSYSIGQRTREIGIRMALGAGGRAVVPLVVWGGMRLVLAGIVVGMLGALALTRFLDSLLYEVSAIDPPTYLGVALALIAVAALACMIPARRAARLEVMAALRGE